MMNNISYMFDSFMQVLPSILGGIVLLLIAWLVATLVRKGITKGLSAANMDERLVQWKAVQTIDQGDNMINVLGQVGYYLVWILFLPGIFEKFRLNSIASPIEGMVHKALTFLPHLISAAVLVIIGVVVSKLVKNLVYNLALTIDVDHWVSKLSGQSMQEADKEKTTNTIAKTLGNIVYVLVLIPIVTVALETLKIRSITDPIINVLNTIMNAIPHVLVAIVLLGVGIGIAKFVGDLITNLLRGTGINNITDNLGVSKPSNLDLAQISGQAVAGLIGLFFFVEALNALKLEVLNKIGVAIIAYLPNVVFGLIILGLGIIGGQWVSKLIAETTGSEWSGRIAQYIIGAFALFMVLDQLNFASTIVNTGFMFIIGGLSIAFALSFGLGGREFAKKQLEKLDKKADQELDN